MSDEMNEKYKKCVEAGKAILGEIENRQMKICTYAMEACTIRHGGRSNRHGGRSNGYYTITDYAKDIGMNAKTLQNWLLIYRNVVEKLTPDQKKSVNWSAASRTNNVIEENITIDNAVQGVQGRKYRNKAGTPPDKVRKLYDTYNVDEKPFDSEFINMVQQTKYFRNLLTKRDLGIIEKSRMIHFMELLDECSEIINEYLTKKKKSA